MKEFSFSTRIFFGADALGRLREVEGQRVLIVTDRFMESSGVAAHTASYLTDCQVTYFSDVVPDPTTAVVAAGVRCLQECDAQVMVAVGGGSVIDAAKAIRELAKRISTVDADIMECFAIPTTSGTGSEVTEYAVISDSDSGVKYPLVSRSMRPVTAILDPALVVSAPPAVTADSGMDVLTHALEAYVSPGASDFSDALAEKAVSLVMHWLPAAYENGGDLLAREKMHNASCLAGLAFNAANLGLCHGMAHAMGAALHLSHGRANAILLPRILQYNANLDRRENGEHTTAAKKYQRMAKLLELPAPSVAVGVSQLIAAVRRLNKRLGIPATLRSGGWDLTPLETGLDDLVQTALADPTTASNPRSPSEADVRRLFREVAG